MCDVKIGRLGKFDFNPRGELWRKDENRFGHKFLSKFGWSQGKGLGKNEDGVSENLKVRLKVGNTGVGWNEKLPVGIDYREYDAVLEDLNKRYQKSGEMKNEEISLEKRSQQFKNRIHYQKFVRGKDTSRYSKKDMSCIFLSRESENHEESPPKESTVTNTQSCPSLLSDKEPVPTFNSQLSIADYFAMKMKNKTGSSLNSSKESMSCKETSQTDVESKKRKHELKHSKKAKRMKPDPEFNTMEENSSHEDTSESSSSQEASEENFVSKEQLLNSEESTNEESIKKKKKSSKKMKKLLGTFNSKQAVANHGQENLDAVVENNDSAFCKSIESCSNSLEESENIFKNEVMSKKRKKEQKSPRKAKKNRVGEVENSSSVEKNSSHSESDDVDKNSTEVCIAKSLITEKQSRKDNKKHKNKISSLTSCLKSSLSNNKYSFKEKKNVSFCESISYKLIENVLSNKDSNIVLETNEQLLSCSDEDCTDGEVVNETENIEKSLVDDLNLSSKSDESDELFDDKLKHTDISCHEIPVNLDMVEDNTVPECFKLPKCSSTNYDSWLETQRIAARMKVYKNMAKKMKRHPVLRKTNLLEIKGYGNWGF